MARQVLRHVHLPGLTHYETAAAMQETILQRFLEYKRDNSVKSPDPTVITAEFYPVYTCGRREINKVPNHHIEYLRNDGRAEFHKAMRGGETTFHGPGQLVAYPVLDLKTFEQSARDYVRMLETTTINMCENEFGVKGFTTCNPGVWVSENEKLCAVGVHLRRHISTHGIGLNVHTDLAWFDRAVMCGLTDKKATSLREQVAKRGGPLGGSVEKVGRKWVRYLASSLAQHSGKDLRIVDDAVLD